MVLRANQANHIEMTCLGNSIRLAINGAQVISVEDSRYKAGAMHLSIYTKSSTGTEIRLDNLVITQR